MTTLRRMITLLIDLALYVFVVVLSLYTAYRVFLGIPSEGLTEDVVRIGAYTIGTMALIGWIVQLVEHVRQNKEHI